MKNPSKRYLGFRAVEAHFDLVHRAAQSRGMSVSDYQRAIVLPWAASDLGEPAPDLTIYAEDVIEQAARKRGISSREYAYTIAREAAAKELGIDMTGFAPRPLSERPAASIAPAEAMPLRRGSGQRKAIR